MPFHDLLHYVSLDIGHWNVTRSKVTGNFLLNALHAFHRFNRRCHVTKKTVFNNNKN